MIATSPVLDISASSPWLDPVCAGLGWTNLEVAEEGGQACRCEEIVGAPTSAFIGPWCRGVCHRRQNSAGDLRGGQNSKWELEVQARRYLWQEIQGGCKLLSGGVTGRAAHRSRHRLRTSTTRRSSCCSIPAGSSHHRRSISCRRIAESDSMPPRDREMNINRFPDHRRCRSPDLVSGPRVLDASAMSSVGTVRTPSSSSKRASRDLCVHHISIVVYAPYLTWMSETIRVPRPNVWLRKRAHLSSGVQTPLPY
jgi:hypothetical protein